MSYQYKNFSELDFDRIKTSFRDYLKNQDTFKDYNFEGSALDQLMNLLAYNTQYNAFYLNMHASERFISTAQRRENVVALAKNLGYTPYSAIGAEALLRLSVTAQNTYSSNTLTIPKYTVFKASTESDTFTFYTKDACELTKDPSTGKFVTSPTGIAVFEGKKFSQSFPFTINDTGVVLPNKNIQTDKLFVTVTTGSIVEVYSPYESFVELDSNSLVYFIEEIAGSKTRIYFGDNIIGKKPAPGTTIKVDYFTTKGASANGASSFTYGGNISSAAAVVVINPKTVSTLGSDIESIESIRMNAPLMFSSQGRAVTVNDYKAIIQSKILPGVFSVACWGGEETDPMNLGYVFISILEQKNQENPYIDVDTVNLIETELRQKYTTVTIFPQVVQPSVLFLRISTVVKYDPTKNITPNDLQNAIIAAIQSDQEANYSAFQTTMRYSKLSTVIDNTSPYIISNDLNVSVYLEMTSKEQLQNIGPMGISIAPGTLVSSNFNYSTNSSLITRSVFLTDNLGQGNSGNRVDLVYKDSNNILQTVIQGAATIDRPTGKLTFNSSFDFIKVSGIDTVNRFKLFANSAEKDIPFVKNNAPILRTADILVELNADGSVVPVTSGGGV